MQQTLAGEWANEGVPLDLMKQLPPWARQCPLKQLPAVNQLDRVVLAVKGVWLPLKQGVELSAGEKDILEVAVAETTAAVLAEQWTEGVPSWRLKASEWTAGVEATAAAAVLEDQWAEKAWLMVSSCRH